MGAARKAAVEGPGSKSARLLRWFLASGPEEFFYWKGRPVFTGPTAMGGKEQFARVFYYEARRPRCQAQRPRWQLRRCAT